MLRCFVGGFRLLPACAGLREPISGDREGAPSLTIASKKWRRTTMNLDELSSISQLDSSR